MPVFNYPDYYINSLRNAVCSNPIATSAAAANCAASNVDEDSPLTFPRIRNNSAYELDADEVRNTLEGMTRNALFGDLAVLRDRQLGPTASCTTCSNPVDSAVSNNTAINAAECISQSDRDLASLLEMDGARVRDILYDMIRTRNEVLAHDRQYRPRSRMSHSDVLSKLEDDYRRWEVERIKKLISSKATIRYRIEVK
jgi:hypothetical protein